MRKIACLFTLILLISSLSIAQEKSNSKLESKLIQILESDQLVRKGLSQINLDWRGKTEHRQKMDSAIAVMIKVDSENKQFISSLLDSEGWSAGLSAEANQSIFLVIQHGGKAYMSKYDSIVDVASTKGFVAPGSYAIFKDRLLMHSGQPQVYGSQTMNGYVWPIDNVEGVDALRKEKGLPPMEEYVKLLESSGSQIIWDKNMKVEELVKILGFNPKDLD